MGSFNELGAEGCAHIPSGFPARLECLPGVPTPQKAKRGVSSEGMAALCGRLFLALWRCPGSPGRGRCVVPQSLSERKRSRAECNETQGSPAQPPWASNTLHHLSLDTLGVCHWKNL